MAKCSTKKKFASGGSVPKGGVASMDGITLSVRGPRPMLGITKNNMKASKASAPKAGVKAYSSDAIKADVPKTFRPKRGVL